MTTSGAHEATMTWRCFFGFHDWREKLWWLREPPYGSRFRWICARCGKEVL